MARWPTQNKVNHDWWPWTCRQHEREREQKREPFNYQLCGPGRRMRATGWASQEESERKKNQQCTPQSGSVALSCTCVRIPLLPYVSVMTRCIPTIGMTVQGLPAPKTPLISMVFESRLMRVALGQRLGRSRACVVTSRDSESRVDTKLSRPYFCDS